MLGFLIMLDNEPTESLGIKSEAEKLGVIGDGKIMKPFAAHESGMDV